MTAAANVLERRGIVVFVAVWAVYALAVSAWHHVAPGGEPAFHLDLRVYRAGAQAFLDGVPLYEGPLDVGRGYEMPFTYPPIAAVVFVPLTWVSAEAAGVIWTLLTYPALFGVLFVVSRRAGRSTSHSLSIGFLGMCLSTVLIPIWMNLNLGQVGIFLMLLVVVDLLPHRTRWPRGLLVGIAASIKLTPAGFILLPLLRKDWRTAAWTTAAAIALTLLGAVLAWEDSVAYWSTLAQSADRVEVFGGAANVSLAGVVSRVGSAGVSLVLLVVCVCVVIALGVVAMRRQLQQGDLATALMINAVVLLMVSPVSWDHHWVWAAPIVLLLGLSSVRHAGRIGPLFVVTAMVFAISPRVPGAWARWVVWGLMYCVLLTAVRPDPRLAVKATPVASVPDGDR
jgi:alpha-1,2-mannosyltransferase